MPPVIAAGAGAAGRGVQNAVRSTARRKGAQGNVRNAQAFRRQVRTAPKRFVAEQSIRAQTQARRRDRQRRKDAEDEGVGTQTIANVRRKNIVPPTRSSTDVTGQLPGMLAGKLNWWLVSAASFCSFWIFVWGLIGVSLIYIGKIEFFWGLINIDTIVPASNFGVYIYLFASGIAFCGYLGIGLWYSFTAKRNPIDTVGGMLVTFLCAAADMAPFAQLFPWMLLWVLLLEAGVLSSQRGR